MANRLADRRIGLRCVLNRLDIEGIGRFKSNTLSTDLRLLHHIGRIFIPKIGRFDFVYERELAMMYHLMQTILINLLGMMLVQIREVVKRVKAYLPYDMLSTLSLRPLEYLLRGSPRKSFIVMMSNMTRPFIR